mgnify:CR=1 FL=1|jgi:hypothetical protein
MRVHRRVADSLLAEIRISELRGAVPQPASTTVRLVFDTPVLWTIRAGDERSPAESATMMNLIRRLQVVMMSPVSDDPATAAARNNLIEEMFVACNAFARQSQDAMDATWKLYANMMEWLAGQGVTVTSCDSGELRVNTITPDKLRELNRAFAPYTHGATLVNPTWV